MVARGTLVNTATVAEEAGVTVRQLDAWTRAGVWELRAYHGAPGRGNHRVWLTDEIAPLKVLGRLAEMRVPVDVLTAAGKVLASIPAIAPKDPRWLIATPEGKAVVVPDAAAISKCGAVRGWAVALAVGATKTAAGAAVRH